MCSEAYFSATRWPELPTSWPLTQWGDISCLFSLLPNLKLLVSHYMTSYTTIYKVSHDQEILLSRDLILTGNSSVQSDCTWRRMCFVFNFFVQFTSLHCKVKQDTGSFLIKSFVSFTILWHLMSNHIPSCHTFTLVFIRRKVPLRPDFCAGLCCWPVFRQCRAFHRNNTIFPRWCNFHVWTTGWGLSEYWHCIPASLRMSCWG